MLILHIDFQVRPNLKISSFAIPYPGFADMVGQSGFFFFLMKVSLVSRALLLFEITWLLEIEPLSAVIVVIGSDKSLIKELPI